MTLGWSCKFRNKRCLFLASSSRRCCAFGGCGWFIAVESWRFISFLEVVDGSSLLEAAVSLLLEAEDGMLTTPALYAFVVLPHGTTTLSLTAIVPYFTAFLYINKVVPLDLPSHLLTRIFSIGS